MGGSLHDDEDTGEFEDEPWRAHPATEKQKKKLRFFGVRIKPHLTKGEASDLIQAAMDEHPDIDAAYEAAKDVTEDLEMLEWMLNDEDVRDVCHYKKLASSQIRQMHEYFTHHVPDWKQKSTFELGDCVARVLPSQMKAPPKASKRRVSKPSGCLVLLVASIAFAVIALYFVCFHGKTPNKSLQATATAPSVLTGP